MFAISKILLRRSHHLGVVCASVLVLAGAVSASPALAAPEWGVTSTHLNGFGSQGFSDPFTGDTTTFVRGSGYNHYTLTVKNIGSSASGTANVGNTLPCSAGTWTGSPSFAYQWLRNGTAIAGATTPDYTTVTADAGTVLQCRVTGSSAEGSVVAVSAASIVNPQPATAPPSAGTATITGTASVGGTLTCNTGTWTGSPSYVYQWLSSGVPILGASASTYAVVSANLNKPIQCEITGTNAGGSTVALTASKVPGPVVPTASVAPALTGTASSGAEGDTEQCESVAWTGGATGFTYQWLSNGEPIAGATGSSYTITAGVVGTVLQCQIIATNATVGDAVTYQGTTLVVGSASPAPPSVATTFNPAAPTGTATPGDVVTCKHGTWVGSPTEYIYQWLSNGKPISGVNSGKTTATEYTYTVQAEVTPSVLQCQVTAVNAGGAAVETSIPVSTKPTATGAATFGGSVIPTTATNMTIEGTISVGAELTCTEGTWSSGSTETVQWLRNGAPIVGATSLTYTTVAADAGKAVECQVTATNSEGTAVAATKAKAVGGATSVIGISPTSIAVTGTDSVASTLTCAHGTWTGVAYTAATEAVTAGASFAYQWLRNGSAISGATGSTYTPVAGEEGKAIQCQVALVAPGGIVLAYSTASTIAPSPPSASAAPSTPLTVSVVDQLPAGMLMSSGSTSNAEGGISGTGWSCTVATATCTRSGVLLPGESYPAITVIVSVGEEAADPSTNVASVSGGGASAVATASDPTAVVSEPFGVQSFTTGVTEWLGNPFTQAGGHPFAANTEIVFDPITTSNGETTPSGNARNLTVELPPGFIGDPQATPQCPLSDLPAPGDGDGTGCPADTAVGYVEVAAGGTVSGGPSYLKTAGFDQTVYNAVPTPGHAALFGFNAAGEPQVLYGTVRSDGDYGINVENLTGILPKGVSAVKFTFCGYGVTGAPPNLSCTPPSASSTPFLTLPTKCTGAAPVVTLRSNSYEDTTAYASMTSYAGAPSAPRALAGGPTSEATPVASSLATGCNLLSFNPTIEFSPSAAVEGTTQADQPTGMEVDLKVPQTNEASINATPELKNAVVMLPEGLTVDPSAAGGLQVCSNAQFGVGSTVEPAEAASCPLASQIGTLSIVTPLLEKPLGGEVFLGEPECSPCTNADAAEGHIFRLFLQVYSKELGVVIKLAGKVSANPSTGRLQATFSEQPQLPFSELTLRFKGGPRAALATPQTCGATSVASDFTPWSAPGVGGLTGEEQIAGTPDKVAEEPSLTVDWNGQGGACPGSLPFAPGFSAGTTSSTAGSYSDFSLTFSRNDREQDLGGITAQTPPGLLGKIAGVAQCAEAQANAGTCGPESQIGTTTAQAGPGSNPYTVSGGRVYLTGPYKGQPFGLSIVVPAVAGPFNLGNVVVRAAIAVNSSTAALTITSNSLPQIQDGVPFRLRAVEVEVNRPSFMFNATNCSTQQISASISGEHPLGSSEADKSSQVSSAYTASGCAGLPFKPQFTATTQGNGTTKGHGASLVVKIASKQGPGFKAGEEEANIAKADVSLPLALSSRLTTLQKACTESQFAANPAGCPAGAFVGTATATTPLLSAPLTGPAILVSHGGAAFPDLVLLLQAEGVKIELVGHTQIKSGITYSKFETVPDAPVSSFELNLPEKENSILGAITNLCKPTKSAAVKEKVTVKRHGKKVKVTKKVTKQVAETLLMPTTMTGQNGAVLKQNIKIAVTGCKASKPAKKPKKKKKKKGKGKKKAKIVNTNAKGKRKHV